MPSKKLTKIQEQEIINLYKSNVNLTCPQLAIQFGVSDTSIRNIFYKHKIPLEKRTSRKITGKIDDLIFDYKSMTVPEIAKKYNITKRHVYDTLKKNDIEIIRKTNKNMFNETFFTKESPELAYLLGFALGDGTIQTKGPYLISFQIHKKDVSVLQNFAKWTNFPTNKIYKINENYRSLTFSGKNFIINNKDYFKKFGLIPNKTYNPIIPLISKNMIRPFLIGLIDSDGHVKFEYGNQKGYRLSVCGNPILMNWVIESFRDLGFNGDIYFKQRSENNAVISINRKLDVFYFVNEILEFKKYSFYLKRKLGQIPTPNDILGDPSKKSWKWKI